MVKIEPQPGIMEIELYEGGASHLEGLEKVFVKIRDKILPATITKLPFVKTKYKI